MPVLITIIAALGAVAFWYYRIRAAGEVARDALDAAQRARGFYRRRRFRQKAENSPIAAVEDPAAAAVAMLVALAGPDGDLSAAAEEQIRVDLRNVVDPERLEETFTFGHWLARQVTDPNDLSLKFAKLWLGALTIEERLDLYRMAARAVAADGEPSDLQRESLVRLKDRLGLFRV